VGRLNLLPRARIAARSLAGKGAALRQAELAPEDVELSKEGPHAVLLLNELLEELEAASARWGLVSEDAMAVLVERL
jgi:hypothetical protein